MNSRLSEKEGFAALVLRLRAEGIADKQLMLAVEQTPRSIFVPPAYAEQAYSRRTLPLDCGEYMEGADLSLKMLHMLGLEQGHRVLEVGTGSGFTAAVMARMVDKVATVDRYATLVQLAVQKFSYLGIENIAALTGDGQDRRSSEGMFDRILVSASFAETPRGFADRLASRGVMIAAIGPADGPQTLVRLTKVGSRFEREDLFSVRFQPIRDGAAAIL